MCKNETYFDEFTPFKNVCEEIQQNNILTKIKLSPFQNTPLNNKTVV